VHGTERLLFEGSGSIGRGGPASDLADAENAVGAPSFAHSAKGGKHKCMRNGVLCRATGALAASQPALANNARTGHPLCW